MTKEEIIDMAKKCGWDNPAINMSPLYEFAKLIAEKSKQEQDMPVAYINVTQRKLEWAKYTSWETPTVVNLPKIPLYTKPQQGCDECGVGGGYALYCVACAEKFFEAKLKEKNN